MTADQFAHVRKMIGTLRARLLARQSTAELERKALLASRRQRIWTQEELDLAKRRASENQGKIKWE